MITQSALDAFKRAQHRIKLMEEGLTLKKAVLKDVEDNLLDRLEHSEKVEKGKLRAEIDEKEKRTVSWKSIVQKAMGEPFVVETIKNTPPKIHKHVVVKEVKG